MPTVSPPPRSGAPHPPPTGTGGAGASCCSSAAPPAAPLQRSQLAPSAALPSAVPPPSRGRPPLQRAPLGRDGVCSEVVCDGACGGACGRVVRGTRCAVRAVQRMFTAQPLSSVATPTDYLLTTHYLRLTASSLLELGLGDHAVVIAVKRICHEIDQLVERWAERTPLRPLLPSENAASERASQPAVVSR